MDIRPSLVLACVHARCLLVDMCHVVAILCQLSCTGKLGGLKLMEVDSVMLVMHNKDHCSQHAPNLPMEHHLFFTMSS